jgi:hypothetical protein
MTLFRLGGGGGDRGSPYFINQGKFAKWMDVKNFAEKYHPTKPKQAITALSGMTRQCHISETS